MTAPVGEKMRAAVAEGTVKWYDPRRGEGYILRVEGPDVHVPASALLDPDPGFLIEGQSVEFELLKIPGGFRAKGVRVVGWGSAAPPNDPPNEPAGR